MPATMHCASRNLFGNLLSANGQRTSTLPPAFLLPAFSASQTSCFSTSHARQARKDGNPARGISAIWRSGLNKRTKLSVKLENLPKPVLDPARRQRVETDDDHGLWGFFNEGRTSLMTPDDYGAHGRGWTVAELRFKDWNDLHKLWWACVKEMNRVQTYEAERARMNAGYGEYEAVERMNEIRKTQKAIKHVLTENWYSWDTARHIAVDDPEVNFDADPEKGESAFVPMEAGEDLPEASRSSKVVAGERNDVPPPTTQSGPGEARI